MLFSQRYKIKAHTFNILSHCVERDMRSQIIKPAPDTKLSDSSLEGFRNFWEIQRGGIGSGTANAAINPQCPAAAHPWSPARAQMSPETATNPGLRHGHRRVVDATELPPHLVHLCDSSDRL